MADTPTFGLPLYSPLLPVHHPMAETREAEAETEEDRKSTRLNSSDEDLSRMPSSA